MSKVLQGAELRYTNIEKLTLALVVAGRKLRPYFLSHQVVALTNHPLKKILSSPEASGRMTKWAVELSEYEIEYQPRPTIKAQVLVDFIVEMETNGAGVSAPTWTIHVDGSSTSGGSGAGVLVENPQGDQFQYATKFCFPASNNEAEYEALIMGIKLALAAGAEKLITYNDSQLIVNQVQGNYEAKEDRMKEYLSKVKDLIVRLENFEIKQIPRAENEIADQLAKFGSFASGINSRTITFITCDKEEIGKGSLDILCANQGEPSWKDEIIKYLSEGELPPKQDKARKLRVRAARFTLIDGELYKRGYSQPYLKCLAPDQANYVLWEIHERICGNHLGGKALARKALRQGYFWPAMRKDALKLVRRCRPCQEHANLQHQPATRLQPIESPVPFAQWGMDLVGPFSLAVGQRKFLIVVVDYFIKWVEAKPFAKISEK
ncbi:uncharacterized protein [Henckelia pumila]|uniref:uncharacterized protein n=1 Tax=Henckelia pumila TaxID=405737 RepID=UPI003C6E3502